MALQGSLRDFSATEILQLLGTQKKTGCLTLEREGEQRVVFVLEGRVVSTRLPGLPKDDPLLEFLRQIHRLSEEQLRGVLTIQKESGRDLEDLLLNGRYMSAEELGQCVERLVIEDLDRLTQWSHGTYRFDPHARWTQPPLVRLAVEGLLMESARRSDERKRYLETFPDTHQLLSVRDLPDPNDPLTEEERELFGIIDGRRTLTDIIAASPLTEFETYESLQRMLEAGWIEAAGRRDPGVHELPPTRPRPERHTGRSALREALVAVAVIAVMAGLMLGSRALGPMASQPVTESRDVYAAARLRDLRSALDLFRRERGTYPERLDQLVEDRWVSTEQTTVPGYVVHYRVERDGADYRLDLQTDR